MIELFQHNFDDENRRAIHKDALSNAEDLAELKAQLEEARQQGFDAGTAHGRQQAQAEFEQMDAERHAQIRESISAQLAELATQDDMHRHDTERDIVELFSAVAERLVPELLDHYGISLAVDRIRQSVEQARTDPVLTIKTSPEIIAVLESETPGWLSDAARHTQIDLLADPEMNQGAARVQWKGGRLEYDLHEACCAMLKALHDAAGYLSKADKEAGT